MSDVEQAQQPGSAPRSEGFRGQVHGWFTSTGAPPAWGLVGYMCAALWPGRRSPVSCPISGERFWEPSPA
jgi:hypothetical protein